MASMTNSHHIDLLFLFGYIPISEYNSDIVYGDTISNSSLT